MAGTSNTSRTLKLLRDQSYMVGMVERWIPNPRHPAGGVRKDLFGFIDMLAVGHGRTIGVQSCGQAFSAHEKKILECPEAAIWIGNGNEIWLIGWRKLKVKRGGKAVRWFARVREFTPMDFGIGDGS